MLKHTKLTIIFSTSKCNFFPVYQKTVTFYLNQPYLEMKITPINFFLHKVHMAMRRPGC